MDYNTIENLVISAKQGDPAAKEALAAEFATLILSLSKKSYINSYEREDIKNECYKTLFKCVRLYDLNTHRFVAYATNAIKNTINNLIRVSVRRGGAEGPGAFILDGKLENVLSSDLERIDDLVINQVYKLKLRAAIKNLKKYDQELIEHVYFKGNSLREYSKLRGISYSAAVSRKANVLAELRGAVDGSGRCSRVN